MDWKGLVIVLILPVLLITVLAIGVWGPEWFFVNW